MVRVTLISVAMILCLGQAAARAFEESPGKCTLYTPVDAQAENYSFVPQGLGLTASMDSIAATLDKAQQSKQLTGVEVREYLRRLEDLRTSLASSKSGGNGVSFAEMQTMAKDIYALSDAINRKLIPLPPEVALSKDELAEDYQQLRLRISQTIRDGRIEAHQAKRYRLDGKRIYESALASKESNAIAQASRDLRKLNEKVQTQAAYRVKPQVGNSFLNLPRVL